MSYPKQSIETFGRQLLETGDLDPIYIALSRMNMDDAQLGRWLVAYWCFYHAGVASWMSEQDDYWGFMHIAAENVDGTPVGGRWPRGSERRHFRGQQAIRAMDELNKRWEIPADMVYYIAGGDVGPQIFAQVAGRAKEHRGFGPWISFKIADMIDRLSIQSVSFDEAAVFMFEDPAKAAEMLYRQHAGISPDAKVKREVVIPIVVDALTKEFAEFKAPPEGDRPVGLQEVETILCKWKSHMNGHYPPLNDIHEILEGNAPWTAVSQTAKEFEHYMPKGT